MGADSARSGRIADSTNVCLPLQVSQHPQATVWTLSRTTTPHTGLSHCRPSQRWTLLARLRPPSPRTAPPLERRYPSTELAGRPTHRLPPTPPASSTHPHPASRPPSDPPPRHPQICYRVPPWTVTRDGGRPASPITDTRQLIDRKTINVITALCIFSYPSPSISAAPPPSGSSPRLCHITTSPLCPMKAITVPAQ